MRDSLHRIEQFKLYLSLITSCGGDIHNGNIFFMTSCKDDDSSSHEIDYFFLTSYKTTTHILFIFFNDFL